MVVLPVSRAPVWSVARPGESGPGLFSGGRAAMPVSLWSGASGHRKFSQSEIDEHVEHVSGLLPERFGQLRQGRALPHVVLEKLAESLAGRGVAERTCAVAGQVVLFA